MAYRFSLLTPKQMSEADAQSARTGISEWTLMHAAGKAVADHIDAHHEGQRRIYVLAGNGNNGGDALVAAHYLAKYGHFIRLCQVFPERPFEKEAAQAFEQLAIAPESFYEEIAQGSDLIIDGILGAGLSKDIEGSCKELIDTLNTLNKNVISIDLPSGVDGETGQMKGCAVQAKQTITFCRAKPAHYLMPARELCGNIKIYDIGIPDKIIEEIRPKMRLNHPDHWKKTWQAPSHHTHKYKRGHVAVISGSMVQTGASRLSAQAAAYSGAGIVSIFSRPDALPIHAAHISSIMLQPLHQDSFLKIFEKRSVNSCVIGPAFGIKQKNQEIIQLLCSHRFHEAYKGTVFDADALTLLSQIKEEQGSFKLPHNSVLTPHKGEFERLFPDLAHIPKIDAALKAAQNTKSVVIYKGTDTLIAAPDGRLTIQDKTNPWLSVAGSGDVLAGIISAFLANGMPPYEAACAAVYCHGAAAKKVQSFFMAEDLIHKLPETLHEIFLSAKAL